MKICEQGLANVAGAVIRDIAMSYLNAKYMALTDPTPENISMMEDYKAELLSTPWNYTGLSNVELLELIERNSITIMESGKSA